MGAESRAESRCAKHGDLVFSSWGDTFRVAMLEWLIIGGGVHGTLVSRMLLGGGGCAAHDIRVLDPWPRALHRWWECTENVGMDYLRSSLVHHLDEDPMSLERFARSHSAGPSDFLGQYQRPSLELWREHTLSVVDQWDLDGLRLEGRAIGMTAVEGGYEVETDHGALRARRVVVAVGSSDRPRWPGWARSLQRGGERIQHLFDAGFRWSDVDDCSSLVLVGGGISAAQAAIHLARTRARATPVRIVSRHPLRLFDFDTDSTWLGPRRIRSFDRLADPGARRSMIDRARHRGSTPLDVAEILSKQLASGAIEWILGEIDDARSENDRIRVEAGGRALSADAVVLATGFSGERPGEALVDSVAEQFELECAPCGYPLVDRWLCWGGRLFLTGPLAELELGPAARNIHGARLAGQRLVEIARS